MLVPAALHKRGALALASITAATAAVCFLLLGRAAGLCAALALATNAFFLVYAQEARGYSLVTLMCALSMYFFLDALDRPRRWSLAGYVIASVLAFYAHYFAVYVTVVQLV